MGHESSIEKLFLTSDGYEGFIIYQYGTVYPLSNLGPSGIFESICEYIKPGFLPKCTGSSSDSSVLYVVCRSLRYRSFILWSRVLYQPVYYILQAIGSLPSLRLHPAGPVCKLVHLATSKSLH
jgi:hypothetical protein